MVFIGKHVFCQLLCGDCGMPITNRLSAQSTFFAGSCQKEDCESFGIGIVVEKSSMQIIAIDATAHSWDGKRIYPVMADKDGEQVWPKK